MAPICLNKHKTLAQSETLLLVNSVLDVGISNALERRCHRRIYIEKYEADTAKQELDTQQALWPLIDLAAELAELGMRTGRSKPSVIT